LAGDGAAADGARFGDEVTALRGVAEEGGDARFDAFRIEAAFFGFPRHARVKFGDDSGVGEFCLSYFDFDAPW